MNFGNTFVIRWTDKQGTKHRKEYTDYLLAKKARKYLVENGAEDADLAIVKKEPVKPLTATQEQSLHETE